MTGAGRPDVAKQRGRVVTILCLGQSMLIDHSMLLKCCILWLSLIKY